MSLAGIALYTERAALFSLLIGGIWLGAEALKCRGRHVAFSLRRSAVRLVLVCYLAALIEITVLRGGGTLRGFWRLPFRTVRAVPFETTIGEWRGGLWRFCYHVIGNLLWFAPLGFLWPKIRPNTRAARVAALAAMCSLGIEGAQWLLRSGTTDVDDVILNVCGALLGYGLSLILKRRGMRKEGGS